MTKSELISKGKHKVRNTPSLMSVYVELYIAEFGRKPVCAGCTFNDDWEKFKRGKTTSKNVIVADSGKTYRFKQPTTDMLSYRKDGITYRKYANKASDHFIEEYLTYGSETDLTERKKMFAVLPEQMQTKPKKAKK